MVAARSYQRTPGGRRPVPCPAAGTGKLPGRAVSAVRRSFPGSAGVSHVIPVPPDHFAGYHTVYNTVLLVSPFPRPTVTVTSFSGTQEKGPTRDPRRNIRRRKRRRLMPPAIVTLAIAAFLSGAVTAVFVMLVAGIHAGDRPRHLTAAPDGHLEALTRTMLGVGVRTGPLASHEDGEKN